MDDEMSRLQKCVALSSTKTKYVAITEAGKEMIWMTNYLEELDNKQHNNFFIKIVKVSYS